MDFRKCLAEERGQTVAVAVPDHQQLFAGGGVLVPHDIERHISAQKRGILVLFCQKTVHIQPVRLLTGDIFHRHALPGNITLYAVRLEPVDAGGGVQRTIKIIRRAPGRSQRSRGLPHCLQQRGIAAVCAQAGPVVVCAVEDRLIPPFRQRTGDIYPYGPRFLRSRQIRRLVEGIRALRQIVLPYFRRRRDQSQIYRDVRFLRQLPHTRQILFAPAVVFQLGNQPVAAEVDAVKLPFAQQVFIPGLQPHPAIPQGELIGQIGLQRCGIASVRQRRPGEFRHLPQVPVLNRREGPVRQDDVQQAKARQKQTENRRRDTLGSFGHVPSLFSDYFLHCNLCKALLFYRYIRSKSKVQKWIIAGIHQRSGTQHQRRQYQ